MGIGHGDRGGGARPAIGHPGTWTRPARPGPAAGPGPLAGRGDQKMTVPEGFKVELVASEPDIVNPVAMTFDERAHLDHREPRVSPEGGRPGPRPRQGPRRHRRRRQGRQVHGLRRGAEHPLAASPSATAASGSPTRPTSSSMQDTDGDGKADKPRGRRHRLRPRRHARAAQLAHLGPRRLALRPQRRLQPQPASKQPNGKDVSTSPAPCSASIRGRASSRSSAKGRATPGASPSTTKASAFVSAPA